MRSAPLERSSEPLTRRAPLRQGKGMKRAGRLPAKRAQPRRGRLVLTGADRQALRMAAYDRAGGCCEAGVADECLGRVAPDAFEWHHRKLRSQGGDDVIANSLCLCSWCHGWVHRWPAEARGLGLIVPRTSDPAERAVTLAGGRMVRLTADNGYDPLFDEHGGIAQ